MSLLVSNKMEVENENADVTLGISIPVDPSKKSKMLTDYNQTTASFFNDLHFFSLPHLLDPNMGMVRQLPSSNIVHEKSTFNSWNIEPYFLNILPLSTSNSGESSILVFGGLNPSSVMKKNPPDFDNEDFVLGSTIFQYLLKSETWKYYGTMIEPRCYHACVLHGEFIYITGGYSLLKKHYGEMLAISTTDRLNLNDRHWENCADMITSRAAHALVSHNGCLYAFGGRNSQGNILASVEMYYPGQDMWLEITPLPQPTMGFSTTSVMDTIWLLGGITDHGSQDPARCLLSNVISFTPSIKRWCEEEPLPYACAFSSCVSNNYAIWLIGGCTISKNSKEGNSMVSSSTILEFPLYKKPSKWKPIASLLYPRHASTAVLYDGFIYVLAGIESANKCASDKVEIINCIGNINVSNTTNVPVPITGCTSVLILQETSDYGNIEEATNSFSNVLERENYRSESSGKKISEVDNYPSKSSGEQICEVDTNKYIVPSKTYSIKETSEMNADQYTSSISDNNETEIESFGETIVKRFKETENSEMQKYSEIVMKEDSLDKKDNLNSNFKDKMCEIENLQNIRYRASMEIFLNSSDIAPNVLKKQSSSAFKWLTYLQKLSMSDEKLHEEIFQSKEPKLNLITDDRSLKENVKSAEVKYFEKDKTVTHENENVGLITCVPNSEPSESFMYVQSNIKSPSTIANSELANLDDTSNQKNFGDFSSSDTTHSTDLEMDNLSLLPPDTTGIKINEDYYPLILLLGGERSRKTFESKFILSYYCNENDWKHAGYMPEYRCHHCAVFLNNKIYITGGFDSENSTLYENITNKTMYYDIYQKIWHNAADFRYSRAHHCAVILKDKIYILGGRNQLGNILCSVEVYEESSNQWRECQPLPWPILGAASFTINDSIFIFGGITDEDDNEIISPKTANFDPKSNSWTIGSDMPIPLAFCGISSFSNSVWLFGGLKEEEGGLVSSEKIFKFNILTETWSKFAELSIPRFASVTISVDNKVYVIGGHSTQERKEVLTCELIDLVKNEISTQNPLPIAISGRAGIVITRDDESKAEIN